MLLTQMKGLLFSWGITLASHYCREAGTSCGRFSSCMHTSAFTSPALSYRRISVSKASTEPSVSTISYSRIYSLS